MWYSGKSNTESVIRDSRLVRMYKIDVTFSSCKMIWYWAPTRNVTKIEYMLTLVNQRNGLVYTHVQRLSV